MQLNTDFITLKTMLAMVGIRKVCARLVPGMLRQEQKDHRMQVSEELLRNCETESESFVNRTITGDMI